VTEFLREIGFFVSQITWLSVLDIGLVTLVIFAVLYLVRGTQAAILLRGIIILVIAITLLTNVLQLQAFSWVLEQAFPVVFLAIPVIFATEIRRGLERVGRASWLTERGAAEGDSERVIDALVNAAGRLAERRHGALIVVERQVGLNDYMSTGHPLDAGLTADLLLQIFYPNTPMHDGAVIVRGAKIAAAGCVMPLTTNPEMQERGIGLRHRAGLGITEVSDSVAIVVSEETGIVSVVHNGRMIRRLDRDRLRNVLGAFYRPTRPKTLRQWLRDVWRSLGTGRRSNTSSNTGQGD
jgi:diadenylate cyclase